MVSTMEKRVWLKLLRNGYLSLKGKRVLKKVVEAKLKKRITMKQLMSL